MAVTIADAVAQLQTLARGMAGIVEAPEFVPESANQFPFAISYANSGSVSFPSKGWAIGQHELVTELHFSRISLPAAIEQSLPYFETFIDLIIADPKLNGTIDTVTGVSYEFGQLEYNGTKTLGWLFRIGCKLMR